MRGLLPAALAALIASLAAPAQGQSPTDDATNLMSKPALAAVGRLVQLLAKSCPVADAADQAAYDACRKALFASDVPAAAFAGEVKWGGPKPGIPEWRLPLSIFNAQTFADLYLPLFMFNGSYRIERPEHEAFIVVHVATAFRNRLKPGEFPYPFWHNPDKWQAYQDANAIAFYIDPLDFKVWYALREHKDDEPRLVARFDPVTPPKFDGRWMWTDADGKTQPAVTLFDGLLSADNPHKATLEQSYKAFALELRAQSCTACHSPENPKKMSPLVLMQSPAHALGEIGRIRAMVAAGRMPLEEWGTPKVLTEAERQKFLAAAKAFGDEGAQALGWEKARSAAPAQ